MNFKKLSYAMKRNLEFIIDFIYKQTILLSVTSTSKVIAFTGSNNHFPSYDAINDRL